MSGYSEVKCFQTWAYRYSLAVEYLYAQNLRFDQPPQYSVAFIYLSYSVTHKNSGVRYWGDFDVDTESSVRFTLENLQSIYKNNCKNLFYSFYFVCVHA